MTWITKTRAFLKENRITQETMASRLGMTQGALGHWLQGRREPSIDDLKKLAAAMGMTLIELLRDDDEEQDEPNTASGPAIKGQVPEISWIRAGSPTEAVDNYHPGDGERMVKVTVPVRRHTYALKVKGDSMVDPTGMGPSFPEGITIIVEPDEEPRHRRFVVVKCNDEEEATFKQLIIDGNDWYLKPLNPDYKTKPFPTDGRISGVVVQAVWMFD